MVDLNVVIASVGAHLFSFLPLGSLLLSPVIVNTTFNDAVYECLGQATSLTLSSCKHLRQISDTNLIILINKIVNIRESSRRQGNNPSQRRQQKRDPHVCTGFEMCPHSLIKMTHLDLSRCRNLTGHSILYCLRHMPNIEQLLLSSTTRFDAEQMFDGLNFETCEFFPLSLNKLKYMDFSGCSRLNSTSIKKFLLVCQPRDLIHLDLSAVSNTLDDKVIIGLGLCCPKLESLNIAGATKLTAVGVGLIAYICRHTLKQLNLRGCVGVNLPLLLMGYAFKISNLLRDLEDLNRDVQQVIPPNLVGDFDELNIENIIRSLADAVSGMMNANPNSPHAIVTSLGYHAEFKRMDAEFKSMQQSMGYLRARADDESGEYSIFDVLEHLDISLIGNRHIRLEGCIATIAWLSGGRLKHVNLCGLQGVMPSDLSVLACLSRHRLKSVNVSSSEVMRSQLPFCPMADFYSAAQHLSVLDLSCCDIPNDNQISMSNLTHLRSLKLDYSNIDEYVAFIVIRRLRQLISLSVRGCTNVTSRVLISHQPETLEPWELLELDCRDIKMDHPLSEVRMAYPSLLKLNNRCTALGTTMLQAHRSRFLWRVGMINPHDHTLQSDVSEIVGEVNGRGSTNECCTIFRTGLSQAIDTEQEMFACMTCGITFGHFICHVCAKKCHVGHDINSVGTGCGYCDCCVYTLSCQCSAKWLQ